MLQYDIPLLIVAVFLILNLIIGLYSIRRNTTFQAYAVGNKRFSTAALVVTLLATFLNGAFLVQYIPQMCHYGLQLMIIWLMVPFGGWLMSQIIWRMGPFLQHLSIAETIGSVYGKIPRVMVALASIAYAIGMVTNQIKIIFLSVDMYSDVVPARIIMVIIILIVISYAALGGIYAVTMTDIFQFLAFMTIIILLCKLMYLSTELSIVEIITSIHRIEKFQLSNLLHFNKRLLRLMIDIVSFGLLIGAYIPAPYMQRAYMASSPFQVQRVFRYSSFVSLCIILIIILMSLFIFTIHPISKGVRWPYEEVFLYIMAHLSPFYKGLMTVAILGMCMSTIDSCLHVAAVTMAHDIIEHIPGIKCFSDVRKLIAAKCSAIVIGLLAAVSAICKTNLFDVSRFVIYFYQFFHVVVAAPFILALLGFRGTSRTALIGMATGILTVISYWYIWISTIYTEVLCVLANGLAMMAAHYLLPQPSHTGWIGLNSQQKRMRQFMSVYKKHKKNIDIE
ncbi:Sodium:solute symporter family protein [Cardinium endosymbiont of Sogatella furcifera]|uniref:sodium:solute symporter family protein n=1 Tax=Cardinium endosymbiont of Sogatella furcifera TaxID=650378 RepID=UPI000E0D2193|nr:hypothetical protein [Cardinium endosymbiont of Sogatella furcifera]AXI24079.1 Sodium:solute symporter family protein [Cardinium endosymbiont of Sogatella furcifera]